jgi:hypothetical protein
MKRHQTRRQVGATPTFNLDAMLTAKETASWLKISVCTLLENVRKGKIPVKRYNSRLFRFHPRTILAASK